LKRLEKEKDALLFYITMKRIVGEKSFLLKVSDFPILEKYAKRLEEFRDSGHFYRFQMSRVNVLTLPYWRIQEIDEFWNEALPMLGFAYIFEERAFFFNSRAFNTRLIYSWKVAYTFVEELWKRNLLGRVRK